mgnify:CR=1 FL=1
MRTSIIFLILLTGFPIQSFAGTCKSNGKFTLLLHGGAGAGKTPAKILEKQKKIMGKALQKGFEILKNGGTSVSAVEEAIRIMENSPVYNAGRGGVPNEAGFVELDASIMRGKDLAAGATAATQTVKNPITAARTVMEKSRHVFFVGKGADKFAKSMGLKTMKPSYFKQAKLYEKPESAKKFGTVGAVALDSCGDLAAGTSTGGFDSKTPGRVGDSPVIGAGTYANNKTCAVSSTVHGEYFIRFAAAVSISHLMEYKKISVEDASKNVIFNQLKPAGGIGGVIVLDKKGNMAWPYSSKAMIRGYVKETGERKIGTFKRMEALTDAK